jgi:Protein of unknown function DUF2834
MKPKTLYVVLCLAGVLVPYWQFLPWLFQHGLNLALFVRELFANRISAFFGMNVFVSAPGVDSIHPNRERASGNPSTLTRDRGRADGRSLARPLFLYLRELELERKPA